LQGSDLDKLESIFSAALACDEGDARTRYLDGACGDNGALRQQVEDLITAHGQARSFLDVADTDFDETLVTTGKGASRDQERRIGQYRILQEIGEGGFGVVYMAEQEQPVRRQVALKVIKLGMDTRRVIARFEAERQALAMMDHLNIARVLDAGATSSGRPYFVMELVRGEPITEYCERNKLSIPARLSLFLQVCHAVQHAHQKGIIHRDIKPRNILVTLHDGDPTPKVIDFGIAKATSQRLTEKTLFTELRQFIGTPVYMSPDQAEISGLDVDTRTDIYSLGVVLYEMLTATTPFEAATLQKASLEDLRHILREVDPPKPSTRVASLSGPDAGPRQNLDLSGLSRRLRGDLDWIVMKALEKDRTRRYQSASELARDIERHLTHEPVSAGPPSFSYRASKFMRRNRAIVLGAGLVTTALVVGLALAITGYVHATEATRALAKERDDADAARIAAERARTSELRHRRNAEAANQFLRDMLRSVDPSRAAGREVTVRYILDEAARSIAQGVLAEQPLVEADMRVTLGQSYDALGLYAAAEQQLRAAISLYSGLSEEDSPDSLVAECHLAGALNRQLRYDDALALLQKIIEPMRRLLGPEHAETLTARSHLAVALAGKGRLDEAEQANRLTLNARRRTLGPEHRDTLLSRVQLAAVYQAQQRFGEAETELKDALATARRVLGEEHPDVTRAMNYLASTYEAQQRYDDAEALYRESWALAKRVLGPEHPQTQLPLNALLRVLRIQGKVEATRPLMKARLAQLKKDAERPDAPALALHIYAWELLTCEPTDLRDPPAALEVARRCVERDGRSNANYLETLALAYQANGDLGLAVDAQERALDIARAGGPYDPAQIQRKLMQLLVQDGRLAEATSLAFRDIVAEVGRSVTEDFSSVGAALIYRADESIKAGNLAEAEQMLNACLALRQRELAPDHWAIADVESRIGDVLMRQNRFADAEPFLKDAIETMSNNPRTPKSMLSSARQRLTRWERESGSSDKP
jgi:serine/threonine protein kinase